MLGTLRKRLASSTSKKNNDEAVEELKNQGIGGQPVIRLCPNIGSGTENMMPLKMNKTILNRVAAFTILLLSSTCAYSLEKLQVFPTALIGVWIYETGDKKLDGCKTERIAVNKTTVSVVQECIDEGQSVSKYRIKDVLVDRAFFSNKINEYHILTDGPNVVFDFLSGNRRSSIYLQFWVTDDYGPTRQLGAFNLR